MVTIVWKDNEHPGVARAYVGKVVVGYVDLEPRNPRWGYEGRNCLDRTIYDGDIVASTFDEAKLRIESLVKKWFEDAGIG
jgi:hypothetical protein